MFQTTARFAVAILAPLAAVSAAEIPPLPPAAETGYFISDYAGLLSSEVQQQITAAQKKAFQQYHASIVVVTIPYMRAYGDTDTEIEPFTEKWFDKWRIGAMDGSQTGNRGLLVLVSLGDQKVRIECAAGWSADWSSYCNRFIDRRVDPYFEKKDYATGINRLVELLTQLADEGPETPPFNPLGVFGAVCLGLFAVEVLVVRTFLTSDRFLSPEERKGRDAAEVFVLLVVVSCLAFFRYTIQDALLSSYPTIMMPVLTVAAGVVYFLFHRSMTFLVAEAKLLVLLDRTR